jgi:uncharacterized membrane-anchored protein YitT (DUF2179 family)
MKKLSEWTVLPLCAALSALNYKIFVFPNDFAPAGLDGICTMIGYLLGINMGYFSLAANLPLLLLGYFFLRRSFLFKTALYTVCFSLFSLLLEGARGIPIFDTANGAAMVLAPIAAATVRGILYAATLTAGGSGGGTDLIAAMIQRKKPHLPLMQIIFSINVAISLVSFFVYGMRFEPVILSILYSFLTSLVSRHITEGRKSEVRFEIITENADALCHAIRADLCATATVLDAEGAYTGKKRSLVICVLPKEKAPRLKSIVAALPCAVCFESRVDALAGE